jgi:hypothetical protein
MRLCTSIAGGAVVCSRFSRRPTAAPLLVRAYSWETFCKLVKHESHFFFTQTPPKTYDPEPPMTSPIARDDRVHIEYVPTQV